MLQCLKLWLFWKVVYGLDTDYLDINIYISFYPDKNLRLVEKIELFNQQPFRQVKISKSNNDFDYSDVVKIRRNGDSYSIKVGNSHLCADNFSKQLYSCPEDEIGYWKLEKRDKGYLIMKDGFCLTYKKKFRMEDCKKAIKNKNYFILTKKPLEVECIEDAIKRLYNNSRVPKPKKIKRLEKIIGSTMYKYPVFSNDLIKLKEKVERKKDFKIATRNMEKRLKKAPKVKKVLEKIHKAEGYGWNWPYVNMSRLYDALCSM